MPPRKPSRTPSKRDKNLPPLPAKSRPGLAVDTSFSRHRGNTPEQVFPYESKTADTLQLGSNAYIAPATQAAPTLRGAHQTLRSGLTQSEATLQAPGLHKRIKGLRPSPLDLHNDISPSDQAITIGLAVPSASLSSRKQSPQSSAPYPQSPPQSEHLQRYGQEIATPTIVITPAKDDFELKSSASPDGLSYRPTSSMYSRHTNGLSRISPPSQRTPPVPPLPHFAAKSNAFLRSAARDSAATEFEEDRQSGPSSRTHAGLSVCTVFEDQDASSPQPSHPSDESRHSSSQYVPTPRRSNGWWNVITSPFSAKSVAFSFRSSPPRGEYDDLDVDHEPILTRASDMGYEDRSVDFADSQGADGELRSAPATDRPVRNFSSPMLLRTPKRSDTAPGAIDPGKAGDVNIYRAPDDGAASSYYDSRRDFPSMIGLKGLGRPRELEDVGDFDPRKSCYQAPRAIGVAVGGGDDAPGSGERGIRESEFYRIPDDGEAAEYYDSKRTFPSLVPYGMECGDKGMEGWSPRRSVLQEPNDVSGGSGSLTESPSDIAGADADRRVPSGQARVVERSPFESGQAAEFEGFSAAYGPTERKFFSTPSEDELNGRTPPAPLPIRIDTQQIQSPMSEGTPVLENAHMATYIGPKSSNGELREVDVASTATPTPIPTPLGNGLGNATMSTRDAQIAASNPPPAAMSEKPPYYFGAQHARTGSQGLGISEDETERTLFPPPAAYNEKMNSASQYPEELPPRRRKSGCRVLCCLVLFVIGILMAALAVLCVFFIPFPHLDVPVQAQWLNLTGFPPLPTGISTVIQPRPVKEVNGCVSQQELWTCAVPAREVNMATPGQTDQPNFRFEIRFRNDTVPLNETIPVASNSTLYKRSTGQAAQAGALVRRTAWTNLLFSSSPAPPSTEDQTFLGRTTDHNSVPIDGEETPFYISLLESEKLTSNDVPGLQKRDRGFRYPYPTTSGAAPSGTVSSSAGSHSPTSTTFATGPTNIPQPAVRTDGKPAPAVLYPFAYAQPLRLFNRGQGSEHYGFYTYYDRMMYLSVSSTSNSSSFGGSIKANVELWNANAVCTWSQTRLLFHIWTQKAGVTSLSASQPAKTSLLNSSANDMSAPGSFPYSVTVTLDRHGGDASEKGVYCYSLNGEQQVTQTVRTWIAENRAFDGSLVNPAAVPMNNGTTLAKRSDNTGIDGGSGGCACQWQNWE